MKIKEITSFLESIAPLSLQESYDNSGLLVGDPGTEITKVLITLDITEEVIDEAVQEGANLIIAHHPIIFKGLKKLTGSNYVERTVLKAIKNDIALYAIHTNLDNVSNGVNYKIAEKVGLKNVKILLPKKQTLKKLITFIPLEATDKVMSALYKAGAGNIGNYSECSFQMEGTGTFKPNEAANPAIGAANQLEHVTEKRTEVIYPDYAESRIIAALKETHPYEEPAFDIIPLDNENPMAGSGVIGELEESREESDFLKELKARLSLDCIRHTAFTGKKVKKVAICGGSGSFLLKNAVRSGADVYISADFKYHEFFDAEKKILIADIGHYESEVFTKELICEFLIKKFTNIAVVLSKIKTNPISYL
ncbi:MAG TPA: Nif3-like dinuclear metal center hexameric protein [Cytophagaceae bacterium]